MSGYNVWFCCFLHNQLSQILFVLCVATFLPIQTIGKPYQQQDGDDALDILAERGLGPSEGVNETSQSRSKRQVLDGLSAVCSGTSPDSLRPSSMNAGGCVRRWWYCPKFKLVEAECKPTSFSCLSSIPSYGIAKCQGVSEIKTVKLSNGQEIMVRITTECDCA